MSNSREVPKGKPEIKAKTIKSKVRTIQETVVYSEYRVLTSDSTRMYQPKRLTVTKTLMK